MRGGCVLRDVHAPAAYLSHEIVYDVAAEPRQGRGVQDWLTVVSVLRLGTGWSYDSCTKMILTTSTTATTIAANHFNVKRFKYEMYIHFFFSPNTFGSMKESLRTRSHHVIGFLVAIDRYERMFNIY